MFENGEESQGVSAKRSPCLNVEYQWWWLTTPQALMNVLGAKISLCLNLNVLYYVVRTHFIQNVITPKYWLLCDGGNPYLNELNIKGSII